MKPRREETQPAPDDGTWIAPLIIAFVVGGLFFIIGMMAP
jgi:hypothetical protein